MKMHMFHMVMMSPWPITASMSALAITMSFVNLMHYISLNQILISLSIILMSSVLWWKDILREANYETLHSNLIMKGIKMGMIFFISSEVMFFFSFFWSFFQSSISPNIEMGGFWPPNSIAPFNPMNIPLLNTLILLSSGVSVTWAHHAIMEKTFLKAKSMLITTVILGVYFTSLQAFEYIEAPFSFQDSSYGSTFFMATGFHGLHVIIGTIFLLTSMMQLNNLYSTPYHIIGFETAAWYWHFVDVVWLFLYSTIYWWGIYF